jgi:hypothetical protein
MRVGLSDIRILCLQTRFPFYAIINARKSKGVTSFRKHRH